MEYIYIYIYPNICIYTHIYLYLCVLYYQHKCQSIALWKHHRPQSSKSTLMPCGSCRVVGLADHTICQQEFLHEYVVALGLYGTGNGLSTHLHSLSYKLHREYRVTEDLHPCVQEESASLATMAWINIFSLSFGVLKACDNVKEVDVNKDLADGKGFTEDFHSWLRHLWKTFADRLARGKKKYSW